MMHFNFHMPTRLIFGQGTLRRLAGEPLPGTRALVVVSAGGSMKKLGYLEQVRSLLAQNGCESEVYDRIQPNPVKEHVMEGAALARSARCDFIVGLGGGSSIDSAKSIALMAANPGDYWDYMGGTGGGKTPPEPALPVIAIPTTAGTGTEADPWTVITNTATREKIGWGNDSTFPRFSIIDPMLMLSVPPSVTACTGMDAFFHATEAYLATCNQPSSDLLAQQAIHLISTFLPQCVHDGSNPETRTMLAWASTAAGICESLSSCISHHSLEHALSAFYPDIPHGAGLVMLSEAYFSHLARFVPERMTHLGYFMGVDVDSLPEERQPEAFVHALAKLKADCGLAELKMSDFGVKRSDLPALARNARESMGGLFHVTPVELDEAAVLDIFEKAYR
ncbi:iron-containing alcohol dehydrogenase [Oleidesulfovibrio alaskensis]|uniref:iron-containing alcohol dehydrogenase n=1 Tax=Oleidesulfovibrio alaskensis TaxID=58180 RepID=UPI0004213FFB|nr:iron-containing alcohol dehydrogenase [Oleidesulfovibrio alaskensis]